MVPRTTIMVFCFLCTCLLVPVDELGFSLTRSGVVVNQEMILLWERVWGGTEMDIGYSVVEVSTGGFALTGITESFAMGYSGAWLLRTDANGTRIWNHTFGGDEAEYCRSIQEVSDGGFILAGTTFSYSPQYPQAWLLRTNATGHPLWNQTYNYAWGQGNSILETSDGGFIFGAYDVPHEDDLSIIRTDSQGTIVSNHTYNMGWGNDACTIIPVSTGGYAFVGTYHTMVGTQVWLNRMDANGTRMWSRIHSLRDYAHGYSLIEVSTGGFAIIGSTRMEDSDSDIWILRTDDYGSLLWDRTYGTEASEYGRAVLEVEGGFLLAANRYSTGVDVWLLHIDHIGTLLSNLTIGGPQEDRCHTMIEVTSGGFLLIGDIQTFGTTDHDFWLARISGPPPPTFPGLPITFVPMLLAVLVLLLTIISYFLYRKRLTRTR